MKIVDDSRTLSNGENVFHEGQEDELFKDLCGVIELPKATGEFFNISQFMTIPGQLIHLYLFECSQTKIQNKQNNMF